VSPETLTAVVREVSLAPATWCAGSAIKQPCEPVPVTHAPEGHRPDAKRRVHRSAARLPARPRPVPLVATNSSPGVCSVPSPPSCCISPPVCWRSITPPVAVTGSWGCTLAASPGTRRVPRPQQGSSPEPPHQNRRTGTNGGSGIWRESELLRHIIASFHDVFGRFSYNK